MNNAEKFKQIFGLYATELWSMPEGDFLEWLNRDVETTQIDHTADIGKKVSISCGQENDLISRRAAIEALARVARKMFTLSDEFNHYLAGLMDGENAIRQLPSVQPEIVRCKDCKHWDTEWSVSESGAHYCPMVDGNRNSDFYCADAERRTDGQSKGD